MFRIPTRSLVQHILTVSDQIDGLAVGHTVLVNKVCGGMMNDFIMSYQTGNLRTKYLGVVPVGSICARTYATENGLCGARYSPALLDGIKDVGVVGLSILIPLVASVIVFPKRYFDSTRKTPIPILLSPDD